jgi:hypothetical protein
LRVEHLGYFSSGPVFYHNASRAQLLLHSGSAQSVSDLVTQPIQLLARCTDRCENGIAPCFVELGETGCRE